METLEQIIVILLVGASVVWGVRSLWRMSSRRGDGNAGCGGCGGCKSSDSRVPCDPPSVQDPADKQ